VCRAEVETLSSTDWEAFVAVEGLVVVEAAEVAATAVAAGLQDAG